MPRDYAALLREVGYEGNRRGIVKAEENQNPETREKT